MRLTKLVTDPRGALATLLSPCRELQEFELVVMPPGNMGTEAISSITSASIRKVTLAYGWVDWGLSWHDINWGAFDEPLCRLVDRLGSTHELEVAILIVDAGGISSYEDIGLEVIASSLAAFREKGRIRLIHCGGQDVRPHVVYPPDAGYLNPSASVW